MKVLRMLAFAVAGALLSAAAWSQAGRQPVDDLVSDHVRTAHAKTLFEHDPRQRAHAVASHADEVDLASTRQI